SPQLGARRPTNRRAFLLSVALALLPFFFLRLDRFFQIPRDGRAVRWIVGSIEALALKTLAATAERLRLDVHQRIFYWKHYGFLSQHFGFDRTQRCVVVKNVNATTECANDEIVFSLLNIQITHGDRGQTAFELNPLLSAVN